MVLKSRYFVYNNKYEPGNVFNVVKKQYQTGDFLGQIMSPVHQFSSELGTMNSDVFLLLYF